MDLATQQSERLLLQKRFIHALHSIGHSAKKLRAWFGLTNAPVRAPVRVLSRWNGVRVPLFLE